MCELSAASYLLLQLVNRAKAYWRMADVTRVNVMKREDAKAERARRRHQCGSARKKHAMV